MTIQRKKKEEEFYLGESEMFHAVLDNSGDAVFIKDEGLRYLFLNSSMYEMLGKQPGELEGKTDDGLFADEILNELKAVDMSVLEGSIITGKHYMISKSESGMQERWVSTTRKPYFDHEGKIRGIVGTMRDITSLKQMEKALLASEERYMYLAYHDLLTGLANRDLFYDRLKMAVAAAKRGKHILVLLYIDLDQFRNLNNVQGHEAGDTILKEAAARIRNVTRESDTVARMGADEFTVILASVTDPQDALKVSNNIFTEFRQPVKFKSGSFIITVSIGIGLYPHDAQDMETLIKKTDDALYIAKSKPGNSAFFYNAYFQNMNPQGN